MKWYVKAFLQKWMSVWGNSDKINYFLQTHITKSLPRSTEDIVKHKAFCAVWHYQNFLTYTNYKTQEPVFYEFGAGWDLVIPILYKSLGISHQILVDIRPNVRLHLLNDCIAKINSNTDVLIQKYKFDFQKIPSSPLTHLTDLKDILNLSYFAPKDAQFTELDSESIDFCSNSVTMEHIPAQDLRLILKETHRILKKGACISCIIDMQDHYFATDHQITYYNFLQYSDLYWRFVNSKLHYQNRLRYPEYKQMFLESGFEMVKEELSEASESDLQTLQKMKIHSKFKNQFTLKELGIRLAWVVFRKT
jgi:predicted SAM-dependent methyltransferase